TFIGLLLSEAISAATTVTLEDNRIIYRGHLSAGANAQVFSLYEAARRKPTELSIRSPGGPIDVGLALGEGTHQQGMDVLDEEFCFSSCADYIFTAGARKILGRNAIVG